MWNAEINNLAHGCGGRVAIETVEKPIDLPRQELIKLILDNIFHCSLLTGCWLLKQNKLNRLKEKSTFKE